MCKYLYTHTIYTIINMYVYIYTYIYIYHIIYTQKYKYGREIDNLHEMTVK